MAEGRGHLVVLFFKGGPAFLKKASAHALFRTSKLTLAQGTTMHHKFPCTTAPRRQRLRKYREDRGTRWLARIRTSPSHHA